MACDVLTQAGMLALRVVMLLVAVAFCYLLFVHSQQPGGAGADPLSSAAAHGQYKEDLDRARAAAKAMQDERREADAN